MKKTIIFLILLALLIVPCAASAATLDGEVIQWQQGNKTALSGATVLIGANIWLDTSSSYDVVKGGKVVGKDITDGKGKFSINAPAGKYNIIIWKGSYVPASDEVSVPGRFDGSISHDNQVGSSGRHVGLRYE